MILFADALANESTAAQLADQATTPPGGERCQHLQSDGGKPLASTPAPQGQQHEESVISGFMVKTEEVEALFNETQDTFDEAEAGIVPPLPPSVQ